MERTQLFLSSSRIHDIFDYLNISLGEVQLQEVFVQDSSDPYTCYNNKLDEGEADVDCGGSMCLSRCLSKQRCGVDSDCAGTMSCFNGKCTSLSTDYEWYRSALSVDWTRIFYIAGISMAVIVVIVLITTIATIIKRKNVHKAII